MLKSVLITGAGLRIGKAIALDLASHGWIVGVHYRSSFADAAATVREIEARGGRAAAVQADLEVEAETASLVERTIALIGPLGALVNNASRFEDDSVETATRQGWDLHMEANLRAPFVLTQSFSLQLPAGVEGSVINIVDERVLRNAPRFVTYTMSKRGLWALTQTLAVALAPRIRVNAIAPGPTLRSARQTPEEFAEQCARTPLGRSASPEDVCHAVRFLLEARAVTGQLIAVDGGKHLGSNRGDEMDR